MHKGDYSPSGQLVGINSAKIQGAEIEGINFAIPVNS